MLGRKMQMAVPQGGQDVTYALWEYNSPSAAFTIDVTGRIATRVGSAGYFSIFLDTPMTGGLWAVELTYEETGRSGVSSLTGAANTNTANQTYPGGYADSIGDFTINGQVYYSGSGGSTGYWDNLPAGPLASVLFVMDADTRQFFAVKSGVLKAGASLSTGPMYFSIGAAGIQDFTINTGQEEFTAGNKAMIAALETLKGKTINQGIWTP